MEAMDQTLFLSLGLSLSLIPSPLDSHCGIPVPVAVAVTECRTDLQSVEASVLLDIMDPGFFYIRIDNYKTYILSMSVFVFILL